MLPMHGQTFTAVLLQQLVRWTRLDEHVVRADDARVAGTA